VGSVTVDPTNPLDELLAPHSGDRRPWWQRRGAVAGAAIVLVIVLVAAIASAAFGSNGPSYRTAVATRRAVDAELTSVATLEPVAQATVGFASSGTVKSATVKVGDEVAAGDVLATLDTTSLEQSLHDAEATLADAELTLENGLHGTKSNSNVARNASATSSGDSNARIVFAAAAPDPELQAAQQAVLDAQHQVDVALATATTAYDNALLVCGITPDAVPADDPVDPVACQEALKASLDAQTEVQTAQHQLVAASVAYDDLLAQRAAQSGGSGGGTGGNTGDPSGGSGSAPDVSGSAPSGGGGFSSGSTSSAPSSADLIAYQKAVDAAAAQVAVAQQALAQATITAPIAGQVVSVALTVGESVSDPSTQNVVIEGPGGFEATTTVGVDDVAKVAVGQRAFVTPDSTGKTLRGKVATVSVAPVSTSGSTSYRVTIALDDPEVALDNGSTATVTIVTEQSEVGLAVPTSAVTVTAGRHLVTVVDGGASRQVVVQVGTVGREWTAITGGISAGDEVALADLDKALPSSATSSSNSNSNFPTVFPGGGPVAFNRN